MPGPFTLKSSGLVVGTLKAALAIAALSILATHFLSREGLDQRSLQRLAAEAAARGAEPVTTGTLAKSAAAQKLDPCAAPRRP